MRLGRRPGNEAGAEAWERGWGGGLGTRLGGRPGNEAGVEAWERGWGGGLGMRLAWMLNLGTVFEAYVEFAGHFWRVDGLGSVEEGRLHVDVHHVQREYVGLSLGGMQVVCKSMQAVCKSMQAVCKSMHVLCRLDCRVTCMYYSGTPLKGHP